MIAAANVSNVSVTCATFRVTGVIGPAGGSLVGPDGVEVHIPAGALAQPTTIGIARSPGGWPMPLIEGPTQFGSIYELTPHDVIFDKPVIIRLPAPNGATDPYALVSSFNEGWQRTDVAINGNYAEMERNVFSWLYIVGACALRRWGSLPLFAAARLLVCDCHASQCNQHDFRCPSAPGQRLLHAIVRGNLGGGLQPADDAAYHTWSTTRHRIAAMPTCS